MSATEKEKKWMHVLLHSSKIFSTCAKKQYAAVVLAPNGRVAGFGYNGGPPGYPHCIDGACPRFFDNTLNGASYENCIAQHAEANALLWSDASMRINGTIIVNGPPCFGCAKMISSSGISRVVCKSDDSYKEWPKVRQFFENCGVKVEEIKTSELFKGFKL
jgi:dCMP deaminase